MGRKQLAEAPVEETEESTSLEKAARSVQQPFRWRPLPEIVVYDTMSRQKRPLNVPGDTVRIYICGVTPYDEAHLGHARPSVVWDVIRRYLEMRGYKTFTVQNFTDVDDKILARAQQTGEDPLALSNRYARAYLRQMRRLRVRPADIYPRVSRHIEEIIEMIQGLIERGHAYQAGGDVYFRVRSYAGYGRLSGRDPAQLLAGARVQPGEQKESPEDFALWKAAEEGELGWPSPWGRGRPGWHIECSAMSQRYLGDSFDLHGGGIDLIFPHHENEIAQSEAYTGRSPCVRHWVHNGLVNMGAEKMSKSLGNVLSLEEVLSRYAPEVIRFYLLSVSHRQPIEFSEEALAQAETAWRRLMATVDQIDRFEVRGRPSRAEEPISDELEYRLHEAMADDFNTALAISVLFEAAQRARVAMAKPEADRILIARLRRLFRRWAGGVLAILPPDNRRQAAPTPGGEDTREPLLRILIDVRQQLRAAKQWQLADTIRDRLAEVGVQLVDTAEGTIWEPTRSVQPVGRSGRAE